MAKALKIFLPKTILEMTLLASSHFPFMETTGARDVCLTDPCYQEILDGIDKSPKEITHRSLDRRDIHRRCYPGNRHCFLRKIQTFLLHIIFGPEAAVKNILESEGWDRSLVLRHPIEISYQVPPCHPEHT